VKKKVKQTTLLREVQCIHFNFTVQNVICGEIEFGYHNTTKNVAISCNPKVAKPKAINVFPSTLPSLSLAHISEV